jgi:hypothetical protein
MLHAQHMVKTAAKPPSPAGKPQRPAAHGRAAPCTRVDAGDALAEATAHAAAGLGLPAAALARVIGVSEAAALRMTRGRRPLLPGSKEGELAALLVRVYRSLDTLVEHDDGRRIAWMSRHHHVLRGEPRVLIQQVQGLVAALDYLDGLLATT